MKSPFLEKLLAVDRRIIFIFIVIALSVPLFLSIDLVIPVTVDAENFYDAIESLPAGSVVLFSFDYDPGSEPELQPMAEVALRHAFLKKHKVIIIGLWPQGPIQAGKALEAMLQNEPFRSSPPVYGEDYVNLGYMAGNELVIQGMGQSGIKNTFPLDRNGTPVDDIPIMAGIGNFTNVDLVVNLSAGYPGTVEWVRFAVDRFHTELVAGNTAVQAPLAYPYVDGKQIKGLLGGIKGAAEYETLVGIKGNGSKYMVPQTFAHLVILVFILIGNVAYFLTRDRTAKRIGSR